MRPCLTPRPAARSIGTGRSLEGVNSRGGRVDDFRLRCLGTVAKNRVLAGVTQASGIGAGLIWPEYRSLWRMPIGAGAGRPWAPCGRRTSLSCILTSASITR